MLDESSTNPRRTFEPSKLVELAHSLTMHGLIQPITVRPKGDRFEVVAGARRYRAAQICRTGRCTYPHPLDAFRRGDP